MVTAKMVNDSAGDTGEFPKFEDVMAEKKVRAQLEAERCKKAAAAARALKATTEPDAPIHPLDDPAASQDAEAEGKRQAIIARGD